MIIVGNTGCAVAVNFVIGAASLIGGMITMQAPWMIAGLVFFGIAWICNIGRQNREEALRQVVQQAYAAGANDAVASLNPQLQTTCKHCGHTNENGWTYCSKCLQHRSLPASPE